MNEHTTTDRRQQRLEQHMTRGRQARSDAMRDWVIRLGGFMGRLVAPRPARLARDARPGGGALRDPLCAPCGS